jgi:hypothetical protein
VPHLKGFWGKLGSKLNKEVDSGYVKLDLNDLMKAHEQAGLRVIYSSYFRWCDFNVLNYASLPKLLQKIVYGLIILFNIPLNLLFHIKYPIKLPQFLYSDMIVVAKKC